MRLFTSQFIILLLLASANLYGQVTYDFSGYITSLQSGQFSKFEEPWLTENLLHNRLKLNVYFGENVTLNTEVRNRMLWGNTMQTYPNYGQYVRGNIGWVEMDKLWVNGSSVLLHSKVDRLMLEINSGKFNLKIGRQRVNWGRTYVWNSNDIFNSYSFFDFDYVERPGADAARLTYYLGMASQLETAIKINDEGKITAAAYTMVNLFDYDIQAFGGIVDEREYAFGIGWAGDLWKFGFKGEATYLLPKEEFEAQYKEGALVSVGLEYMFENQLVLRSEYLYNEVVPVVNDLSQMLLSQQSLRNLSFSKNNVFLGADYPITPLLRSSLSGMWMPEMNGFFAGPSLVYSLKDNLDVSVVGQYFNMKPDAAPERVQYTQAFLKMMYSF